MWNTGGDGVQAGGHYAVMACVCNCGGMKMLPWGGDGWMRLCGEVLYLLGEDLGMQLG